MKIVGFRLKNLRKQRKLIQDQIAENIDILRATYGQYETNRREADYVTLVKIADFFSTSTDYILGRTDDPSPPTNENVEIIDPDLGFNISDLTPNEVEFLNELKEEVAFKDFLKDPEEKKRELIETVKMLMRGRKK